MLIEIQNSIIDALTSLAIFKTVDAWQGDIEELVKLVHKTPSVHVVYSGAEFDSPRIMGDINPPTDMIWSTIIIGQNLRDRKSGAVECYSLVEATRVKLTRFDSGFGWLWPVSEKLLYSGNGLSAYGCGFRIQQNK